jgi:nucleoside-diphosphate-sugar epimerase
MASVFITGASGFMGSRLSAELLRRRHSVRGLVRPGSENRAAPGVEAVAGDALDAATFADRVKGCDTLVQLVGVSHPSPAKAAQFRTVDLASARAAIEAAKAAGVRHFVYVSVAHPAPMMKAYIAARTACEEMIRDARLNATILRPWYVLGPGHRWPYLLIPFYKLFESMASKRESALRLGLVTRKQMVSALVWAVENPARGIRIVEVPEIRRAG